MKAFYDITTRIKTLLDADIAINTVTYGKLDQVLLEKRNIYGVAHVIPGNFKFNGSTVTFMFNVVVMDILDINKNPVTDLYAGNDNEKDVLNTMSAVIVRMYDQLRRGSDHEDGYSLVDVADSEPFTDRFEHGVAGWAATFGIEVATDMTICD